MASESKYKDSGWTSSPTSTEPPGSKLLSKLTKHFLLILAPLSSLLTEEEKRSATAYESPKTISYGALAKWIPHLDTRLDRNNCTTLLRMSDFSLSIVYESTGRIILVSVIRDICMEACGEGEEVSIPGELSFTFLNFSSRSNFILLLSTVSDHLRK